MLQIDITLFGPGTHRVSLHPEAEALDLDPATFGDIEIAARLDCKRDRILVQFLARATASLTCDRTLRPFEQPVEGRYAVLCAPPGTPLREDGVAEQVRDLDPADRTLDLTEEARDTLKLALPARRVAPGAEEEELQKAYGEPEAAADGEPVDPRWAALRKLRSGDADSEAA